MAEHKQTDLQRPDLEESTNVTAAHASLLASGAAQAREKRIEESGMEPVSLWVFLASAVVLLVGGAVLGARGNLFNYNPIPENYVRARFETSGATGPVTGPIIDALMKRGQNLYAKCSGCHGSTGEGDGQNFPPLAGSEWVTGETEQLAMIILSGLQGKISVAGKVYDGNMPSQAPLTATELASIMTYVRNSFGNNTGDVVTPEQAATALDLVAERAAGAAYPPQITADELMAEHDSMLEGESMEATTVVDFETLEPVEAGAPAE